MQDADVELVWPPVLVRCTSRVIGTQATMDHGAFRF